MVRIDFRFHDVEDDLWMLSEYLKMLEKGLPGLLAGEGDRIRADVESEVDPEVADTIRSYLEQRVEEGATVRFLTGSALVAVWASYEAGIGSVARYIAQQKQLSLAMSDLRGDFLTRARRYFDAILAFPLHPPDTDWDHLRRLATLRHAIAHANGTIDQLDSGSAKIIEQWAAERPDGLGIADGSVVISLLFAQAAHRLLEGLLGDLIRRAKANF